MPHFLTDAQFHTLTAICDTLVPSIEHDPDPYGFWRRAASDLEVPKLITQIVRDLQPKGYQKNFTRLLDILDRPLTAGLITGRFRPFADLPLETREQILRDWSVSPLPQLRQGFLAFKRIACALFCSATDDGGRNPNWPAIGYSGPPRRDALPERLDKPIRTLTISQDTTLDCDVVVVGSGAGGGVVAGELARAGKDVIVLEKGGYHAEADFDGNEYTTLKRLYENQAAATTADGAINILAGSTLGGGTTVNWAAAFRTPPHVLEEWEREHDCTGYTGPEFEAALDAVCARLYVNADESEPGPESLALVRGCERLGYHCAPIPRNVNGCGSPPACGWCGYGCPLGAKQGTLKTYLQDAADHGARFVVDAECRRVLIENGKAVGVEAISGGHALTVRARAVVIAAGTIHSPAILIRSGIPNPNIGLNLRLHPTTAVCGEYAEPIETWRGVMMSRYSSEFANLDGRHYGVMLEHPPAHPGYIGLATRWESGAQYKAALTRARHFAYFIALTRDRDAGRVRVDTQGRPRLYYSLSRYDARHLLRGLQEAFRIHAAAGATEISGPHSSLAPYRAGENLEDYLRRMEAVGLAPHSFVLLSAHQMGTCRMGGMRSRSVLDPRCESWDVRNLIVADASTFPTPSGVNPMITVMAVAHRAAQYVRTRV